jgi:hypothetical protein
MNQISIVPIHAGFIKKKKIERETEGNGKRINESNRGHLLFVDQRNNNCREKKIESQGEEKGTQNRSKI